MTREEIIQGLQFTIDMFLFDPTTGETFKEPRNDMDKTTIDACKGAIELLEQQPCEDAISREEAIGAAANLFEMSEYPHPYPQGKPIRLRDIKEKLKQLPPVTPQPKTGHWISVNERLPEKAFGCLVTVEEDDIHGEPHKVIYPDFVGYDGETWNDADGEVIPFDVIAWMPLPKPYKPQESEKSNGTH